MTANPLPPLIILPPVSFSLTIASALIGFLVISCIGRRNKPAKPEEAAADKERKRERKRIRQDDAADAAAEREAEARRADLDRVWDAQTTRDQSRAWDAVEARAAGRRVASSPFEVVQVVEVS